MVLLVILVCAGMLLKCVFEFAQESLVGSVVNLSLFDLRNRFYRNVIHLDVNQVEQEGTSELMARFTNDMDSLSMGIKTLFGKVVAEPLKALSCVIIGCFISWQLTLMFLILVPIAALILVKIGRVMKRDAAAAGAHVEHLQDPARDLPGHPRREGVHDGALRTAPVP